MSFLNPIRSQYDHLCDAFEGRRYLTLKEASDAMNVPEKQVARTLLKLEQKGMLTALRPYVERDLGLVVRDRRYAAAAQLQGYSRRALSELDHARKDAPAYVRRFTPQKAGGLGKAMLNIVQGFAEGRGAAETFRNTALNWLEGDKDPEAASEAAELPDMLVGLKAYTQELKDLSEQDLPLNVTDGSVEWLSGLCTTLEDWNTGARSALASGVRSEMTERAEDTLKDKYLAGYPAFLRQLKEIPTVSTGLDELMKIMDDSIAYLDNAEEEVTAYEVRAAVMQIHALTREIRELYRSAGDNYNRSDARSLKNTYLPMLRKLLEKYIRFSDNFHTGQKEDPALEETIQVLKKDLPAALIHIRDGLKASRAVDLESEAAALRTKLRLDGLL